VTSVIIVIGLKYDWGQVKKKTFCFIKAKLIFIGPKSNHCLPLSLADSLNKLTDITLASEDANFKHLNVVRFEVW